MAMPSVASFISGSGVFCYASPMRSTSLTLATLLFLAPPALADCQQAAYSVAASYGGDVIKVRTLQQGGATVCEIKIRIPGAAGQPPRVETVRVPG